MGATYTRQESANITDGSVIEARHLNNEYNQLEAAFASPLVTVMMELQQKVDMYPLSQMQMLRIKS
jgi:hypothetical protein